MKLIKSRKNYNKNSNNSDINQMKKYYLFIIIFLYETQSYAYIGPGAGIAFLSSFYIFFIVFIIFISFIFIFPFRKLLSVYRKSKINFTPLAKKIVVLGFDGMDYKLTNRLIEEGKLETLKKLKEEGLFLPLETTFPSESPVAWTSFLTGVNPGKHNIYDFITLDFKNYTPQLSSVHIDKTLKKINIINKRKSRTFFEVLSDYSIFSQIIRVPISFPPVKFNGCMLSSMCTPDLLGTMGTYFVYSQDDKIEERIVNGKFYKVDIQNNSFSSELPGPDYKNKTLKIEFKCLIKNSKNVEIMIDDKIINLEINKHSEWIKISFKISFLKKITGIVKFLIMSIEPFIMYITPIHIDPENPIMPISYPNYYSIYLSKLIGDFATNGFAEDFNAYNDEIINQEHYLEQCYDVFKERKKMFYKAIENNNEGVVTCVFDTSDRISHMFFSDKETKLIENLYIQLDKVVKDTLKKIDKDTILIIMSDHGFIEFNKQVDLNRFLIEKGYLKVKEKINYDSKGDWFKNFDFSQTKAYCFGLSGIFLNKKNREGKGKVKPEEEREIKERIKSDLENLIDTETGERVIKEALLKEEIYNGPYIDTAPDIIIGFNKGYRVSWQSAKGNLMDRVIFKNEKNWCNDHCVHPSLVPGVFFCNRNFDIEKISIIDIAGLILKIMGIKKPEFMDSKDLI